ncbi:MAG: branched-chain amino acid ABC transporter permease [Chloroflexi bacterium]|nr:branched-chain amino acid ABC transporter permease [Chloroflexota bacterium]
MDGIISYALNAVVYIGIYAIYALSLNIEYGFTGLSNFGKIAFIMVGAYSYTLLAEAGLHFIPSLILAMGISAFFGFLISLPALRLREDYLAIVTLTFGEILRLIVKSEQWIANGVWGIHVPSAITIEGASYQISLLVNIGLVFTCLAICFFLVHLMSNSPFGRILRAIREDGVAADSLGKNMFKYKSLSFVMGSAIAGLGGALFAQFINYIEPNMFLPAITFSIWIMVIMGGPANNWGVLVGALLVQAFERGTSIMKDYFTLPVDPVNIQYIMFGALIIFILAYRPSGLFREHKVKTLGTKRAKQWMDHS